jgi:uncharacterized protein (TIGR01319 family)
MSEAKKPIDAAALEVVLATDCGSTTTKAVLFEKKEDGWRQTFRGEAPTTVEKPVADVTIGARNSFLEVQELSGRKILSEERNSDTVPIQQRSQDNPSEGIDLYVSTSSAGGGLQMIVGGVVGKMSASSAERAALGAGAIVMDALSADDGREAFERVSKIRHLRPDIVLIAGGTDGGERDLTLELCETLLQADPRPRFGETLSLPVIYAANKDVSDEAKTILEKRFEFVVVDNLRPTLESENLAPARDAVHELFLHHVMSHAPGYKKLLTWTPVPVLPTPGAVGTMVLSAAKRWSMQILAVDIGGATTDVFSVFRGEENEDIFNRTVSANLGMSYSVANVLLEAGEDNIRRWLPFEISAGEMRDRLRNKMIRPTSIPYLLDDLILEQAVCREALRLALIHHKRLATGLKGGRTAVGIGELFKARRGYDLVDMMQLDLIIGSGGVLSHAPDRRSTAFMLLDAYEPEGITRLAVDSIFMMPHLGVFSTVHPEAAAEIFARDCLVDLGTVIAPVGRVRVGEPILTLELDDGRSLRASGGELYILELESDREVGAKIIPESRHIDIGSGAGVSYEGTLKGGFAGIIIDTRGRPIVFPENRLEAVQNWFRAFSLNWEDSA